MWQSKRSRSTGWHSPAVPPVRSASHPGENTSEQPSGKCAACGTPLRCSATTSGSVARSTRTALRLIDFRWFIVALRGDRTCEAIALHNSFGPVFFPIELGEERGVAFGQLAIHLEADV